MNICEYYDRLDRHDWMFAMSDDGRVYNAGKAGRIELINIFKANGKEYEDLYNAYSDYIFSGTPWGTEKKEKPERPVL